MVSDLFALKIGSDRYWLSITAKNLGLGATLSFIGSKTRGEFLIPIDLDAAGDEKKALRMENLLSLFNEISIECGN